MKPNATDQNKRSHEKQDLWLGVTRAEWLISIAAGVTSGFIAGAAKIRSSFAEEVKKWPIIKGMYVEHEKKLEGINLDFENKNELWKEHTKEINDAKDEFAKQVDKVLHEKWGIAKRSEKWLSLDTVKDLTFGTYQRSKFAGANTESKIIFNSIVGMVIGSAATLSFFNGVASRHKIERIEDAVTTPEQSR